MKAQTPDGKKILEEHEQMKINYVNFFQNHKNPNVLANDIERLTFVTLRRFRAIQQFPRYDIDDNDDE